MSAPSFSSFPDLEGGSNSQSVSVAKHEGRKKHKKSTKGKHKDGNAQDRHEGRSDSYQHRSQTVETSDSIEGNTQGSLKSFFSDHKGDALNIRFGSLNSSDIPRYRPIGGGRSALGLRGGVISMNTGKEVTVVPRGTGRKGLQLSDSRVRALLNSNKPRRFLLSKEHGSLYQEIDGFIRFPVHKKDQPDRGAPHLVGVGAESDSDGTSSDGTDSHVDDTDLSPFSAREECLRDLERSLQLDPSCIQAWFDLVVQSQLDSSSAASVKSRAEISVAILSRALKAHPNNTHNSVLWLKYLAACECVWNDSQLEAAWEGAIRKADSVDLRMEWFDWKLRRMTTLDDVLSDGAVLTRKNWQDIPEEDNDRAKLRCFWRIAVTFQQAGFSERANALFQAQAYILYKIRKDPQTRQLSFNDVLNNAETFWESELPRIGDVSHPISTVPPVSGEDKYAHWAARELEGDVASFTALRTTDDNDEDPYSTVLFSDIRPFLIDIRSASSLELFRLVWLSFQGLRVPGLISYLMKSTQDQKWAETSFCTPDFLDRLFPGRHQDYILTSDSVAGTIVGRERIYRNSFGDIREWGYGLMDPLESVFLDGSIRMWNTVNGNPEAIRGIFQGLRLGGDDDGWDALSIAYEACLDPKRAAKLSKQLLSQKEHSLLLWSTHARLARIRGKVGEARKIYETITQTVDEKNDDSTRCWWDFAEMLWLNGDSDDARRLVLRYSGQAAGGTIAVLRAKRHIEELVERTTSSPLVAVRLIKMRLLLELLSGTLQSTIDLGKRYLDNVGRGTNMHEGVTMALLVMIYHHTITLRNHAPPGALRVLASEAIGIYPGNTVIMGVFLESEKGESIWGRVRDVFSATEGSVEQSLTRRLCEIWVAGWDVARWHGELEKTRNRLESAVSNERSKGSAVLWRVFVEFEIRFGRPARAKAALLRAIGECPNIKELYLLALGRLRGLFKSRELVTLVESMAERGLRLRGSIDELVDGLSDGVSELEDGVADEEVAERAAELRQLMPY